MLLTSLLHHLLEAKAQMCTCVRIQKAWVSHCASSSLPVSVLRKACSTLLDIVSTRTVRSEPASYADTLHEQMNRSMLPPVEIFSTFSVTIQPKVFLLPVSVILEEIRGV
jgi:hypothetical protein